MSAPPTERLDRLRMRFVDADEERAFREWSWSDHRTRARASVGFCSALCMALVVADYLILGIGTAFWLCVVLRAISLLWGWSVVRALRGDAVDWRCDQRVLAWTLWITGIVLVVSATRPTDYFFSVVLNLVTALAVYLFLPNRFLYTLFAGVAYSAVYFVLFFAGTPPLRERVVFTASLLFVNVIGALGARSRAHFSRVDYMRLRAEEAARHQLAEALKTRIVLMGTMSHEIRTPLHGLMTCAQLLAHTEMSSEQRELVGLMQQSGTGLIQLVDELLDLVRADASTLRIAATDFKLRSVVEELAAFVRPRVSERGLLLVVTIAADVPDGLHGDAVRLRQLLLNLIENALKFSPRGAISVAVNALDQNAEGVRLRFEVADEGPGVAVAYREAIFEPFVQASPPRGPSTGTGLGLAICKRIVAAMGGTIGVDDAPGGGARFHFSLPFAIGATLPETTDVVAIARVPATPLALLVVEDDEVSRRLATMLFRRGGHRVTLASSGLEAVEHARAQRFDAVLMDVRLPELDGCEATRRIRALPDVERARTPIIATTANVLPGDRERYAAAGMTRVLAKPIILDELLRVLAEVTAPDDEVKIIDEAARAAHVRALGRAEVDALSALFIASSRDSLATLIAAAGRGDCEAVARCAHQLTSACLSASLPRCAAASADLERIARNAPHDLAHGVARLRAEHGASVAELQRRASR